MDDNQAWLDTRCESCKPSLICLCRGRILISGAPCDIPFAFHQDGEDGSQNWCCLPHFMQIQTAKEDNG